MTGTTTPAAAATGDSAEESSKGRNALVGGAAYALVTVAQRALAFLLLPLYARALTPAEYGDLGLLLVATQVFIVVMGLGQNVAVFREWFQLKADPVDHQRYLVTVSLILVGGPALLAAIFSPLAFLVAGPWFDIDPLLLAGTGIGAAVFVSATVLPFTILRVQERFAVFAALNVANALVTTVVAVVGLLVFDWGVEAWIVAYLVGGVATLVMAVVLVPWPRGASPAKRHARSTLKLGLPLLPHQLSLWALQLANRAVLVGLVTKTQVGWFTVAYMLAQPIMLINSSVNQAVMPSYGRASIDKSEMPWLTKLTTYQVAVVVVTTVAFALVSQPALTLLLPDSYDKAAELLPLLCLASGVFSLYAIPMNEVTIFAGRAGRAWIATAFAAAVNIALLFVLVPELGLIGAAWASLVGSAILALALGYYARRVVSGPRVDYDWARLALWCALGALVYVAATATTGDDTLTDLSLRSLWCLALGVGFLPEIRRRVSARTQGTSSD